MNLDNLSGEVVPVLQPIAYTDPTRLARQQLRAFYPFWTVSDRITAFNTVKLANNKHVMHDYIKGLLESSKKVWVPALSEDNHTYFKQYMSKDNEIIPLRMLYTYLIELFLDIDNIGNISNASFNKAIEGTLEI